ncbi:MAG: UDP-N-acetylglucosamine 2-epimerase (hydrolyzing) [Proteobacteria bacterium]|nr:UDP-N-acetylglucosamine 2-epimerase (hydrolyzing) [Pseudomonadota bacterium]
MSGRRRIAVVTGSRADYGLVRPIAEAITRHPALELQLIVAAAHLSPFHGGTIAAIEADGLPVAARVDMLLAGDTGLATAKSIGLGTIGFADAYARLSPDLLLLVGDRFEILAAAAAALPLGLPVAHVHGGEITEGAYDEQIRHAVTKLAHIHFAAAAPFAARIVAMGEEPWRVHVTGAPGLDNLAAVPSLSRAALATELGVVLEAAPLLVTYHPVTLEQGGDRDGIEALLEALRARAEPIVFTAPNADAGRARIAERLAAFCAGRPNAWLFDALGTRRYFNLMRHAAAMVGNSSSGLIEAPSFGLPTVNIGERQAGRLRAANVIDCAETAAGIGHALDRALVPSFRAGLAGLANPYGDGRTGPRIADLLAEMTFGPDLVRKRFHEVGK